MCILYGFLVLLFLVLGAYRAEFRVLHRSLADFTRRYGGVSRVGYNVYDALFRVDCLLASIIWFCPLLCGQLVDLSSVDMQDFEYHLMFLLRYALSEMCCYYRGACKC